jgi:hypothetical protein
LTVGTFLLHAASLHALFIDAHLAVSRAYPGFAIRRIALSRGADLVRRAAYAHTAHRQAFFLYANLTQPGTQPGLAMPEIAHPIYASLALGAWIFRALRSRADADAIEASHWCRAVHIDRAVRLA